MTKSGKLKLEIQNENYDEFNGFEISFSGFDKIPWEFSPMGFSSGKYILEKFKEKLGEFKLTVAKDEPSKISTNKTPAEITLKYDDTINLRRDFRRNYRLEGAKTVTNYLAALFPEEFSKELEPDLPTDTKEIEISNVDIQKAAQLLPFLDKYDIRNANDLKRLIAGRRVLHYLRLEKVLEDFEKRLGSEQGENEWQAFFRKNLLILNPGYIKIIEKTNISINIQLPDFLLLTLDSYVDIYEIKVPETPLLNYDNSHKNFYWSADITKAISQVENYIDSITKNSYALIVEIKTKYGIDLKVVKPRGFIIAGHSRQLRESSKEGNFRLLNGSLKNTEVLPYDSFLERFKRFSKTLKEPD